MIRKPRIRQLAKDDIMDVPSSARWPGAVISGVNESLQAQARLMENGISLEKNSRVEIVEFDVAIPDPWRSNFTWGERSHAGPAPWSTGPLAGTMTPGYRKHWDGSIELRGGIANALIITTFATLPSPCWPKSPLYFTVPSVGNQAAACISISAVGVMTVVYNPYVAVADVSLDGIRYSPADMTPEPMTCWPVHVKTVFDKPPRAVLVLDATNTIKTTQKPDQMPSSLAWSYIKKNGVPTIVVKNMEGLAPNNTFHVRLLVIGE